LNHTTKNHKWNALGWRQKRCGAFVWKYLYCSFFVLNLGWIWTRASLMFCFAWLLQLRAVVLRKNVAVGVLDECHWMILLE
jgi:hypothetical protein